MICAQHDWYDATNPCPACSLAGVVTVTETPAPLPAKPEPEVEVDIVAIATEVGDGLDIPKWLQRNPDNSFEFPDYPVSPTQSAQKRKLEYALDEKEACNAGPHTAIGSDDGNFHPVYDLSD